MDVDPHHISEESSSNDAELRKTHIADRELEPFNVSVIDEGKDLSELVV
jgi:hypothetical protein